MTLFYWLIILLLKLMLLGGLVRVGLGPTRSDRLSAAMLLGTTGTAMLLLLSGAMEEAAFVDVALVLVLLAAIASVTFWRFGGSKSGEADGSSDAV